jgi:MFS family permease
VAAAKRSGAPTPSSLWRDPEFMKLWVGDTISQFGTQITMLAVPLTAAVVLGASPAEMGVLAALETLPFLLLSLPAGAWVDRTRRRPVLIAGDLVRAVALLGIPLAAMAGGLSMPLLYVVAFIAGVATVFFDIAYMAYLPALVRRDQLVEGNSKLELSRSAAQFAGPGIAGFLIGWLTAPVAVVFDAASFLASALSIGIIRRPEPAPSVATPGVSDRSGAKGSAGQFLGDIREGLAVVLRNPILRLIAATTMTTNLFGAAAFATFMLFLTIDLRLDAVQIGIAFGLSSVGSIAGAMLANRVSGRLGVGRTLAVSTVLSDIALLGIALSMPETAFFVLVAGMAVSGLGVTMYNIVQVSLRQSITPHRLQGRMNASMRFLVCGVQPIGAVSGGLLAAAIGVREATVIAFAASTLAVLWVVLTPLWRLREPPPAWEDSPTTPP